MARRLTEDQWLQIRTKYELGGAIRAIAREFDIPHGTIQARIKKENWQQNLATQVTEIKEKIQEISQVANPVQMVAIQEEISETFQIIKSINNLDKGALNLHNMILKSTIDKVKVGKLKEDEAASIAQKMGLSVDKVAARAGIGKEPTTQVNIQNNNSASVEVSEATEEQVKQWASEFLEEVTNGKIPD